MNEVRRQQYLDVIGIDSYMPRLILPFAPAPKQCAVPDLVVPEIVVPELTVAVDQSSVLVEHTEPEIIESPAPIVKQPVAAAGPITSPLDALQGMSGSADKAPVSNTISEEVAVQAVSERQEAVNFSLSVWRVSEDLLVVDSRQAELALPVNALLNNILLALGLLEQALPKIEVVSWPKVDSHFSGQDAQSARDMLGAMFEARLEQYPAKFILLMGESAAHYMLPASVLSGTSSPAESLQYLQGKSVFLQDYNASAIVVPSLTDMLNTPALKAIAWQAIQPLRLK